MAKWVTFYKDEISGKIFDYVIHPNKEEATKHFKNNYQKYFQLATKIDVKLPMRYGFPFRAYYGMTRSKFLKLQAGES